MQSQVTSLNHNLSKQSDQISHLKSIISDKEALELKRIDEVSDLKKQIKSLKYQM